MGGKRDYKIKLPPNEQEKINPRIGCVFSFARKNKRVSSFVFHSLHSKITVAGKHLVIYVPPVRILNQIGIHIPAITVQVHEHGTKHPCCFHTENHLYHHPLNILRVEFYLRHKSLPIFCTNSYFFEKKLFILLCKAYPTQLSRKIF